MESIAIWYDFKNKEFCKDQVVAELHINLWKLPSGGYLQGKWSRFIDFGLLIEDCGSEIEYVNLFFPFDFNKNEFSDLGECIVSDNKLLSTLFNCDMMLSSLDSSSYYSISAVNTDDSHRNFSLYVLGAENFIVNKCPENKGTHVRVKIIPPERTVKASTNDNLYIRFRLNSPNLVNFTYEESLSNDFVQSAFSKVELLDFRINDKREIDNKLLETVICSRNFFVFSKIHFFYIGCSSEKTDLSNKPADNCRILESKRWSRYIDRIKYDKKQKIIAYQWTKVAKKMEGVTEYILVYNLLLKTIFSAKGWRIGLYILSVILFGTLGSLFATLLCSFMHTK